MDTETQPDVTPQPTPQPVPSSGDNGATASPGVPPTADASPQDSGLTAGRQPQAQPPVSLVAAPDVVKPAKRGGLAGFMDDLADAIAGTKGPGKVYKDATGNEYVEHPDLSRKGQWLKIASEAIHGAGAGAGVKPGPGQKGRAFEAGVNQGDEMNERDRKHDQQLTEETRQSNQDLANSIKLKHDLAAKDFELQRLKVKATQDDVNFAQSQLDREKQLGSADLGIYKDEADLARVKDVNPTFWKDVYQNRVVAVPELSPDGTRSGIHLFLRTSGVGSQLADQGTPIKIFTPGKTPNDPPTLRDEVPTVPMTHDMVDAYNNAAFTKYQDWHVNQQKQQMAAEQIKHEQASTKHEGAATAETNANTKKIGAETGKIDAETQQIKDEANEETNVDLLVQDAKAGRIVPERLGYMLGKKEGQKFLAKLAAADPEIDTSKLQSYPKLYQDFTSGKTSQTMRNLNTAFQHIDDLRSLNTTGSRVPGTDAAHAFESKLTNASAEIANSLAKPGATATKEEIAQIKKSLSPFLNRDSAITTQVHSMVEQYKSLRNVWAQGAPSRIYEDKMPDLSPEGKDIIRKYAPQDANAWWGRPVVDAQGKVLGYTKDGKTMEPRK